METWISGHLLTFLGNHQDWLLGFLAGAILTHPANCAVLLFNAFIRVPGVGRWVANNPEKAKGWFDAFAKAIDDCVDRYDKAHPELDDTPTESLKLTPAPAPDPKPDPHTPPPAGAD